MTAFYFTVVAFKICIVWIAAFFSNEICGFMSYKQDKDTILLERDIGGIATFEKQVTSI